MPKYIYSLVKCPYCAKECKSTGLHKHVKTHGEELYQEYQESKKRKPKSILLDTGKVRCIECDFESNTVQSVSSHWWLSHTKKGKSHSSIKLHSTYSNGRVAWNKGLTKETDVRVKKYADSQIGKAGSFLGKTHTEETKKKISAKLSINNKGGRSKWYEVAGQKVQGTWERNVALKFEELHIKWKKLKTNRDTLEYVMDEKTRCYTPDFYLPDSNVFIEIKGHWWGKDREKMDIVLKTYPDIKIIIVEKDDYEKILRGELVW